MKEFSIIELSTQNLHFHDNASIYSVDSNGRFILTAGGDKEINMWSLEPYIRTSNTIQIDNLHQKNSVQDVGNMGVVKNQDGGISNKDEKINLEETNNEQIKSESGLGNEEKNITEKNVPEICIQPIKITNEIKKKEESIDLQLEKVESLIQEKKYVFEYNDALKTSVKINYIKSFQQHSKSVNSVRYNLEKTLFASCSDGGEVIVWKDDGNIKTEGEGCDKSTIRYNDGDDAYDLVWGDGVLFVGLSSGKISVYEVEYIFDQQKEKELIEKENLESTNEVSIKIENNTNFDENVSLLESELIIESKPNDEPKENKKIKDETEDICKENTSLLPQNENLKVEEIAQNIKENGEEKEKKNISIPLKKKIRQKIKSIDSKFKVKHVYTLRAHTDIVQGLSYNHRFNVLASMSKDRTCKTFSFDGKRLNLIDKIYEAPEKKDEKSTSLLADENSKLLFRRLTFSHCGTFLYMPSCIYGNSDYVYSLHYPFRSLDFYGKIGPLETPSIKIVPCKTNKCDFIVCKKNIYVIDGNASIFNIRNVSFYPITDGCCVEGILCLSSLDGFLTTLKLK